MANLVARVARLDHDQVYWGLEDHPVKDVKAGDLVFGDPSLKDVIPQGAVYVDLDCDLPGGKYRWNSQLRRFDPLPRGQQKEMPQAPTLEQAFYDFCLKFGVEQLPTRTAAWCQWMKNSVDERMR
jgi:hypothetical protein